MDPTHPFYGQVPNDFTPRFESTGFLPQPVYFTAGSHRPSLLVQVPMGNTHEPLHPNISPPSFSPTPPPGSIALLHPTVLYQAVLTAAPTGPPADDYRPHVPAVRVPDRGHRTGAGPGGRVAPSPASALHFASPLAAGLSGLDLTHGGGGGGGAGAGAGAQPRAFTMGTEPRSPVAGRGPSSEAEGVNRRAAALRIANNKRMVCAVKYAYDHTYIHIHMSRCTWT